MQKDWEDLPSIEFTAPEEGANPIDASTPCYIHLDSRFKPLFKDASTGIISRVGWGCTHFHDGSCYSTPSQPTPFIRSRNTVYYKPRQVRLTYIFGLRFWAKYHKQIVTINRKKSRDLATRAKIAYDVVKCIKDYLEVSGFEIRTSPQLIRPSGSRNSLGTPKNVGGGLLSWNDKTFGYGRTSSEWTVFYSDRGGKNLPGLPPTLDLRTAVQSMWKTIRDKLDCRGIKATKVIHTLRWGDHSRSSPHPVNIAVRFDSDPDRSMRRFWPKFVWTVGEPPPLFSWVTARIQRRKFFSPPCDRWVGL